MKTSKKVMEQNGVKYIPVSKLFAENLGLEKGTEVEVEVKGKKIIVTKEEK